MAKKIKWGEVFEDFLFKTDSYSQVVSRILERRHKTLKEYTKTRSHVYYMNDILDSIWYCQDDIFTKIKYAWDSYCHLLENHPNLLKND